MFRRPAVAFLLHFFTVSEMKAWCGGQSHKPNNKHRKSVSSEGLEIYFNLVVILRGLHP